MKTILDILAGTLILWVEFFVQWFYDSMVLLPLGSHDSSLDSLRLFLGKTVMFTMYFWWCWKLNRRLSRKCHSRRSLLNISIDKLNKIIFDFLKCSRYRQVSASVCESAQKALFCAVFRIFRKAELLDCMLCMWFFRILNQK